MPGACIIYHADTFMY